MFQFRLVSISHQHRLVPMAKRRITIKKRRGGGGAAAGSSSSSGKKPSALDGEEDETSELRTSLRRYLGHKKRDLDPLALKQAERLSSKLWLFSKETLPASAAAAAASPASPASAATAAAADGAGIPLELDQLEASRTCRVVVPSEGARSTFKPGVVLKFSYSVGTSGDEGGGGGRGGGGGGGGDGEDRAGEGKDPSPALAASTKRLLCRLSCEATIGSAERANVFDIEGVYPYNAYSAAAPTSSSAGGVLDQAAAGGGGCGGSASKITTLAAPPPAGSYETRCEVSFEQLGVLKERLFSSSDCVSEMAELLLALRPIPLPLDTQYAAMPPSNGEGKSDLSAGVPGGGSGGGGGAAAAGANGGGTAAGSAAAAVASTNDDAADASALATQAESPLVLASKTRVALAALDLRCALLETVLAQLCVDADDDDDGASDLGDLDLAAEGSEEECDDAGSKGRRGGKKRRG